MPLHPFTVMMHVIFPSIYNRLLSHVQSLLMVYLSSSLSQPNGLLRHIPILSITRK